MEIKDLPQSLVDGSRQDLGTDFTGYIPPGEAKVLMMAEGIPIKEVKIHNNVAVLEPGESAISGKFALCSAVLAKKGDKVFVMHIYPKRANYTDKYIQNIIDRGIVSPNEGGRFDKVLLIGREASLHVDKFAELSNDFVQTVSLDEEKKGYFNLLVYNDPQSPGELFNFDLWFDES